MRISSSSANISFICFVFGYRFHVLTEFDEAKRSCRKRLAEHNRRRRKPAAGGNVTAVSKDSAQPPSKKPNSGAVSSSYTADNNSKPSSYR